MVWQVGEIMNDRYEVFATHGKGVFSTVLRARDKKPVDEKNNPIPIVGGAYPEVAIKVHFLLTVCSALTPSSTPKQHPTSPLPMSF